MWIVSPFDQCYLQAPNFGWIELFRGVDDPPISSRVAAFRLVLFRGWIVIG